jgi:hypothetical protein
LTTASAKNEASDQFTRHARERKVVFHRKPRYTRHLLELVDRQTFEMASEINLTSLQVSQSLSTLERSLRQYIWLQKRFNEKRRIDSDIEFQTKFNGYYRVRRSAKWRAAFYALMTEARECHPDFVSVLRDLHKLTGRVEPSFASKLVATVDSQFPVIDSVILSNLNLKLPYRDIPDRTQKINDFYIGLCEIFDRYLLSEPGKTVVSEFRSKFPLANISPTKMLDLVLSQAS